MKGAFRMQVLRAINILAEEVGYLVEDLVDTLDAILAAGPHANYKRLEWEISKIRRGRKSSSLSIQRSRYHSLISKLRKEGLIQENSGKCKLTLKGKGALSRLENLFRNKLPQTRYKLAPHPGIIIVAFDIPERERRKRDWLREVLKNLELKMIQKSVWFGKVKIPKELIEDLDNLGLSEFVEIFEVSKTGTLKSLI